MFIAEIEATNSCNTRCVHCPHESISRPKGAMDWPTYETIIKKLHAHTGGKDLRISYSGMGEPVLNPLIYKFIQYVSSFAHTGFSSNGTTLTENNVKKLIDAGLDLIYFSFSGDEPKVFNIMSGGLSFERVLKNLRSTIELSRGTRLKVSANIVITKKNRNNISKTRKLLKEAGADFITYSLCHSRGGNLKDSSTCDTPPMPAENGACEVLKGTLFIDWQGKAHICDHDLHGEYLLGDVVNEPLEVILERRDELLKNGLNLKMCNECNDAHRIGGTLLLGTAISPGWMFDLLGDRSDLSGPVKTFCKIFQKDSRVDRVADKLLSMSTADFARIRNGRNWKLIHRAKSARNAVRKLLKS